MTSRDVYFFGNACAFSSGKAVSVLTSVIGGLGAPWRSANLLTISDKKTKRHDDDMTMMMMMMMMMMMLMIWKVDFIDNEQQKITQTITQMMMMMMIGDK